MNNSTIKDGKQNRSKSQWYMWLLPDYSAFQDDWRKAVGSCNMKNMVKNDQKRKLSIAWSLKPVLYFMKISEIPTYYEPRNKYCILRNFEYLFLIIQAWCLLLNCFFQIHRFIEDCYNNTIAAILKKIIHSLQITFEQLFCN